MAPVSSLSAAPAPIFRQYTYDNSFLKVFTSTEFASQYQVSLAFARDDYEPDDYDREGPSNGLFLPRWNTDPSAITAFKKKFKTPESSVKVFVSIGSLESRYPFNPKNTKEWIQNAINSLTSIIKDKEHDWQVDGIDIYYRHIKTDAEVFSQSLGEVIKTLKDKKVITLASISPSDSVSDKYELLYKEYGGYIDWVDYQFQYEDKKVDTPDDLVALYDAKAKVFSKEKLFAGYSAENDAWGKVSPIVFFVAGMKLLHAPIPGASIYYYSFGN